MSVAFLLVFALGMTGHLGHKYTMRGEGLGNLKIHNICFRGWIKDVEPTKKIEKVILK